MVIIKKKLTRIYDSFKDWEDRICIKGIRKRL